MMYLSIAFMVVIVTILLPINDLSRARPIDFVWPRFRDWVRSFPRYRIVQTRNSPVTEQWYHATHKYQVQTKALFWPFWSNDHSSFELEKEQEYVKNCKEELARERLKPVIIPVD